MFIKSPNSSIWSKILSTLTLLSLVCLNHVAQAYPNGPVKLVIPASAGGTTDILARLIAKPLSDAWQVPVIVENRVGAGGVIGASVKPYINLISDFSSSNKINFFISLTIIIN